MEQTHSLQDDLPACMDYLQSARYIVLGSNLILLLTDVLYTLKRDIFSIKHSVVLSIYI